MKFLIYIIIIIFILRWIGQAFKSNITYININRNDNEVKPDMKPGSTKISGKVDTKTKGDLGDYVDYEEV